MDRELFSKLSLCNEQATLRAGADTGNPNVEKKRSIAKDSNVVDAL